jgi:hypothetical protein
MEKENEKAELIGREIADFLAEDALECEAEDAMDELELIELYGQGERR